MTKHPLMALRFWDPNKISSCILKPSPISRSLPKHNQLHVNTFTALLPLFSPLVSSALHVGCFGVSHTSYSPNPKQIGFRHRRKPSVWPSPRRLLPRNPINRQHMAIGYGMDYEPRDACGPLASPAVTRHPGTHFPRRGGTTDSHFNIFPSHRRTVVSHS